MNIVNPRCGNFTGKVAAELGKRRILWLDDSRGSQQPIMHLCYCESGGKFCPFSRQAEAFLCSFSLTAQKIKVTHTRIRVVIRKTKNKRQKQKNAADD